MKSIGLTKYIVAIAALAAIYTLYSAEPKTNCNRELSRHIRACQPYSCNLRKGAQDFVKIHGVQNGRCVYETVMQNKHIHCALTKDMLEPVSDEFKQKAWIEELGPIKKSRVVYKIDHEKGTRKKIGQIYIGGLWLEPAHALQDATKAGLCQSVNPAKKALTSTF